MRLVSAFILHPRKSRDGHRMVWHRDIWDHLSVSPTCLTDGPCALQSVTNRLTVPAVKLFTIGSRAFSVSGPQTWNQLPEEITSATSRISIYLPTSPPDIFI